MNKEDTLLSLVAWFGWIILVVLLWVVVGIVMLVPLAIVRLWKMSRPDDYEEGKSND